MKARLLILFACAAYVLGQNSLRPSTNHTEAVAPSDNTATRPIISNVPGAVAPNTHTFLNTHSNSTTGTTHMRPTVPYIPIPRIKCVIKGEFFQKCVNEKDKVYWNEQYTRTFHCFRYGICQLKGNKCDWSYTKEMNICLDDMRKSKNKIVTE